jgi:LuxR family maltose regulon positive regulatory protein
MKLGLATELVEALETRTEGWITCLQLAALALQGMTLSQGDHSRGDFVREFSGSDRYIIDYLLDEVLERQLSQVRLFLQQTVVLKELSAPLCAVVRRCATL